MMKLLVLLGLVALAAADVSDLFKGNKYNRYNSQSSNGQYNGQYNDQYNGQYNSQNNGQYNGQNYYQRPKEQYQSAKDYGILRSDFTINPDGSYDYAYDTENGISAQQHGQQNVYGQESGNAVQGSYKYNSPEGVPVAVNYVADENGYQPQSDLLPTQPPIPPLILRSLQYNAAHPEPELRQRY